MTEKERERERGGRGEARDLRLQIFSSFRNLSMSRDACHKLAFNEAIKIHHLLKKKKKKKKERKERKGTEGKKEENGIHFSRGPGDPLRRDHL